QIPVNDKNEMLESPIDPGDPRGELLRQAALIIWDEAPMANKAVLVCVEALRRIMGNSLPFGGKVLILLGDFRQTCPVVRQGSRAEVV
ncbi:DNA helicase Pif1 like protein, partial [Mycena pura]